MKSKIISGCLIIILIMSSLGISAFAKTQEQKDLENQQNKINNEISSTKDEIEDVKTELSESAQEVQSLINQISSYEDKISELNSKISETEDKISEKEQEITNTQNELDEKQELLEQRLVALYESGNTSYIELLLSSADITDFISKYYLISELATYDTELIATIRTQKEELENSKTELEDYKTGIEADKSDLETTMSALNSTKKEKETKMSSLSSKEQELSKELEELKAQESAVSAQIQKLKEEYDRQLANGTGSGGSGSTNSNSATSSYGFGWPVSNPGTLGTLYGATGSYWTLGYHTGVDFRVSTGTAVYSVGNGQVVDTGWSNAYGNYVEIYHGNNIYSFYAHNSSVLVSEGQVVSKGQQISKSGATGNVTGPHLHFEIRTPGSKFSNCVNPLNYLP